MSRQLSSSNDAPSVPGVYLITNVKNGRVYVGSSINVRRRLNGHKQHLNKGNHHSLKLQRAWNKYGSKAFRFAILLQCSVKQLLIVEQATIDEYCAVLNGYNNRPMAENNLGHIWTKEAKERLSAAKLGIKRPAFSPEWRARIAEAGRRRVYTCGYKHTDEARANMSKRRPSAETKAKISAALKGRKKPPRAAVSDETRKKLSASLIGNVNSKGKVPSAETRAKLSVAISGMKRSLETRSKMSASALQREANRRGER